VTEKLPTDHGGRVLLCPDSENAVITETSRTTNSIITFHKTSFVKITAVETPGRHGGI
jgi:hypothetical protein